MAQVPGTLSDGAIYEERNRICDLGYLRKPYKKEDGKVGYRCASEPEAHFEKKGGACEKTEGRKCLCNALLAACGFPQTQKDGTLELPLMTAGDDLVNIKRFIPAGQDSYDAEDVLAYLLGETPGKV